MTLIGYAARFGPLVIALTVWSVQSVEEELLRAARGLGAAPVRVAWSIIAPILKTSLVGLCALFFALCAGELTVTVLVQSPGGATLPLPIFSLLHAGFRTMWRCFRCCNAAFGRSDDCGGLFFESAKLGF